MILTTAPEPISAMRWRIPGKDGEDCDGSYKKTGFKSSTEAEKEMVDKGYTVAVRPYYRTTFDCEKSENCEVP